jgi:hypothetical protein
MEKKMRFIPSVLTVVFLSCPVLSYADIDHRLWDQLLKKDVVSLRGGQATQMNYNALLTDRSKLKQYLAITSKVTPTEFAHLTQQEQMAFLINSYNAWTADLILTKYPDLKSIKDLGSFFQSPWKKDFIPLLGKTESLDDIETQIRAYHDPRVHFAINCASIGCPALRPQAYEASQLDAQLDNAAQLFLADRTRNRVQGNQLFVSSIFKWYSKDFESGWKGTHNLSHFLGHYAAALGLNKTQVNLLNQQQIDINFLPYNWNLNKSS